LKPINNAMAHQNEVAAPKARTGKRLLKWALVLATITVAALAVRTWRHRAAADDNPGSALIYRVRRGDLTVSVTEGGVINAMESLAIKSEVEGQTRILSIVPEGIRVTAKDVEDGMVLVKLDSSALEEKESQQEITYESARAAYTEAKEGYEIQKQQNESDITLAELRLKFAKMDLQHYLGEVLAEKVVNGEVGFDALPGTKELGGVASQDMGKLEADIELAREELSRAKGRLEGTEKLEAKGYVSRSELEADQLALKRSEIKLAQAQTARDLFLKYELPKTAQQLQSDCQEAQRELERVQARARSELAQAEARLKSKEAAFNLQKQRLDRVKKDIENCTIRATKQGLVVYASTVDPRRFRDSPIEEGFMVRERQTIITMPNMSTLAVKVNIHESNIQKIHPGQPAHITVEALPGKSFSGHVAKISLLASSENRWLNPDIMVYSTDVAIDNISPELKPGMSGTVEIIVEKLHDVLFVPIQAVTTRAGQRACWVRTPDGPQLRSVETGDFTDKYVVIKSGLAEGDEVFLAPPEGATAVAKPPEQGAAEPPVPETEVAPQQPKEQEVKRGTEDQAAPEMTPQGMKEMRERLEKMTPQEREKFMEQARKRMEESGGRPPGR